MKKMAVFLVAVAITFTTVACGGKEEPLETGTLPGEKSVTQEDDMGKPAGVEEGQRAFDFPDLGIKFIPCGVWDELRDNLLIQTVYGSEVDPVSGIMVDFANDEALEKALEMQKSGQGDGREIESMMWENAKRLFAIAWARTGEAPLDTVMELVGGPDRLASVVELGQSGDTTFYFCTYPSEDTEGLSEASAEKYERLRDNLDTARDNISTSQPPEQEHVQAGESISFSTTDLDGNQITSDIFADKKITLVNIWGSFCQPCMEELPDLQKISEDMENQGVAIIGILGDAMDSDGNRDEDVIELGKMVLEENNVTYLNLAMNRELKEAFPTQTYPTSILIDSNGTVIGEVVYGSRKADEYRKIIKDALAGLSE